MNRNTENIIVIAPYPPRGTTYENKFSALASFVKNKISAMRKLNPQINYIILADEFPGSASWSETNLQVRRVWRRGSPAVYLRILQNILTTKNNRKIMLDLEWGLFGKSPILISLMPLFILLLRLIGKQIYVVIHGVALNFHSLSPQLGIKKYTFRSRIFDLGIKVFYKLLVTAASKIIVLEQYFADLINKTFATNKAVCIPHGVDTTFKSITKEAARQLLGIDKEALVLLNFGFLTWYKGSDLLINTFSKFVKNNPKINVHLIMAGGESLIHSNDKVYREFVAGIRDKISKTDKIRLSGFVSEKEIATYFAASDVVVFPYRLFISSSGPLSIAFSLVKPVALSQQLEPYVGSSDFRQSLESTGLTMAKIFYNFNDWRTINKIIGNVNLTLDRFSAKMKEERCWELVAKKYVKLLEISKYRVNAGDYNLSGIKRAYL